MDQKRLPLKKSCSYLVENFFSLSVDTKSSINFGGFEREIDPRRRRSRKHRFSGWLLFLNSPFESRKTSSQSTVRHIVYTKPNHSRTTVPAVFSVFLPRPEIIPGPSGSVGRRQSTGAAIVAGLKNLVVRSGSRARSGSLSVPNPNHVPHGLHQSPSPVHHHHYGYHLAKKAQAQRTYCLKKVQVRTQCLVSQDREFSADHDVRVM